MAISPVLPTERYHTSRARKTYCTAGFQSAVCPLWVIHDRGGRCHTMVHVSFTPKADKRADVSLIPAVGVLRKVRALYPHNAEALAGRRLRDDPAPGAIHHRRAQPFEASHLGGNVVGLDVYVHAALVLDALDLDDRLVCRGCKHAVIAAAHRMVKVHGAAQRGGPAGGGPLHVGGLADNTPRPQRGEAPATIS